MPLAEFIAPEITDDYLGRLNKDQLIELLQYKMEGLLMAMRLHLYSTPDAKQLAREVQKIQEAIEKRGK